MESSELFIRKKQIIDELDFIKKKISDVEIGDWNSDQIEYYCSLFFERWAMENNTLDEKKFLRAEPAIAEIWDLANKLDEDNNVIGEADRSQKTNDRLTRWKKIIELADSL